MTLLTPSALLEIEERAGKATAGPWIEKPGATGHYVDGRDPIVITRTLHDAKGQAALITRWDDHPGPKATKYDPAQLEADAEFIAHARSDIPALLQHISALQEQIERAREEGAKEMRERCAARCDESEQYWRKANPQREVWTAEQMSMRIAEAGWLAGKIRALPTTPQA